MFALPDAVDTAHAVLFDLDGTLVDSHLAHYQSLCDALGPEGITVDYGWYVSTPGMSTRNEIQALTKSCCVQLSTPVDTLVARCDASYRDHLDLVREITWVADLARACYGRKPLAVASNSTAGTVRDTLARVGLASLFGVVVTLDDVSAGKPAPDIFLLAARRVGVEASRCLVLEDSDAGIEAARRAGATVVDVRDQPAGQQTAFAFGGKLAA